VASSYKTSPKRKLVRLRAEVRTPSGLLRTHICDGAECGAGFRACHGAGSIIVRAARGYDLRQAEVENLDAAIARNENVIGLQVAVNDPRGMCGCQTVGDLYCNVEQLAVESTEAMVAPSTNSMTR
jgi:hypothetical protein